MRANICYLFLLRFFYNCKYNTSANVCFICVQEPNWSIPRSLSEHAFLAKKKMTKEMIHSKIKRMFLTYIESKTTPLCHAERLNSVLLKCSFWNKVCRGHFITDYNKPFPPALSANHRWSTIDHRGRHAEQSCSPAIVLYSSSHVLQSAKGVIISLVVWLARLTTALVISAMYFFWEKNGTRSSNRCLKHAQRVYGSFLWAVTFGAIIPEGIEKKIMRKNSSKLVFSLFFYLLYYSCNMNSLIAYEDILGTRWLGYHFG